MALVGSWEAELSLIIFLRASVKKSAKKSQDFFQSGIKNNKPEQRILLHLDAKKTNLAYAHTYFTISVLSYNKYLFKGS